MADDIENEMIEAVTEIAKSHGSVYRQGIEKLGENILENHMSPKDAIGISDQDVEKIYAQAYQQYNMGKYNDAHSLFSALVMADVMEPKYMLGFAACSHMMKNFEEAAQNYMKCAALDAQSPIPYYHAYDCFTQMGDPASAMIMLSLTVKRCGEKNEYQEIKNKADMYLKALKAQVKNDETQTAEETEGKNSKKPPELNK